MKGLERNKQTFYYALYQGTAPLYDGSGLRTGETDVSYSAFKPFSANISAAKGEAQIEQFGASEQYDKIIVTDDVNCEIDENSVLCVDIEPPQDAFVYDYIVKRKAKSLNSISYAIAKVKVTPTPINTAFNNTNEEQTNG